MILHSQSCTIKYTAAKNSYSKVLLPTLFNDNNSFSIVHSVTKFGEISPLSQNFKSLGVLEGQLNICQFFTCLGTFLCHWANFDYCKWPNFGKLVQPSGHTVHMRGGSKDLRLLMQTGRKSWPVLWSNESFFYLIFTLNLLTAKGLPSPDNSCDSFL